MYWTEPNYIGNYQLERVSTFKLLGVKIRHDLKWNDHVDYIYHGKAAKWLYTLRVLKRAGVAGSNNVNIYRCCVRIDQYALPAWQDIPAYLSVKLKSIQKRALKIVFPDSVMVKLCTCPSLALRVLRKDDLL